MALNWFKWLHVLIEFFALLHTKVSGIPINPRKETALAKQTRQHWYGEAYHYPMFSYGNGNF
jgi:hypothetical protein